MAATQTPPAAARVKRRLFVRLVGVIAVTLAIVAVLAIAGAVFLASGTALELAATMLVARSEGRLGIEGATGSLLSSVSVKRLTWRGPGASMAADEVAVTWSPAALFSRGIVVKGLGAQRIEFEMESSDTAAALPPTLALPTHVEIDRVAVANLDWKVGTNGGTLTGIELGYTGGASEHRVDRLSLVTPHATINGSIVLRAESPYAIGGTLTLSGDNALHDARADAKLSGTLDRIVIDAVGSAREARGTVSARLTPLAAVAFDELSAAIDDVDLAAWDATLPKTQLALRARATPAGNGLAGNLEATNAIAGAIGAGRLPVASITTRFAWHDEALALDDLKAALAGGGSATGSAQLPLTGGAGRWKLDVRDVDLHALHSTLVATRLSGSIEADLAEERQRIIADIADRTLARGIRLAMAATLTGGTLAVERLRINAAGGELAGAGRVALAGDYAFRGEARARALDPSHFGAFPRGTLGGSIAVNGSLKPAWHVGANVAIDSGSRLEGVAVEGSARADVARAAVRGALVELKLASARIAARGDVGGAASRLAIDVDAPRLGELAPLLPAKVPRPLAGALRAHLALQGDLATGDAELTAHGEGLKMGGTLALASFDARGRTSGSAATDSRTRASERALDITVDAVDVVVPQGKLSRVRAAASGTLARHRVTLTIAGSDIDGNASAHGALRIDERARAAEAWQWKGTIDTLDNRGAWALSLTAPAALELAPGRIHVGAAAIDVADGKLTLSSLEWDEGRVSTVGRFSGVPAATLARLSGTRLPFDSTMTLTGEWSVAATPRLNGSLRLARERGDLAYAAESGLDTTSRPLGITAAEVSARFRDDTVDATALLRSERGASIDARLAIGAAPDAPPGHIGPHAPMEVALNAELATLALLQPWLGTTAVVDGRMRAALTARGTVAQAPLSGSLSASSLAIHAPQYGVQVTDGRLEARLADGTLTVETLSFAGGAGRFEASGTLTTGEDARIGGGAATGKATWRAERFRMLNRPDRSLVATGSGTLSLQNRKLSLEGSLSADEGHFEYTPDASSSLGDDVVIKGRPAKARESARTQPLPLMLDVEVDLGRRLTFTGEGLDTQLAGKVRVTTAADGSLRGRGSISAINGTYYAFGQKLTIDRGRLVFDGPLGNPGLDIVALRKNLAVEAGVVVSGTVKVPIVQLTSQPPVPDNEKLSWLVLGQGLDRTSGADMAALQAASAALFGSKGKPIGTTIANRFGFDDISVKSASGTPRSGAAGPGESSGQVVAIGKRLTDRLSLIYEQGLTVASNALRLEYQLTRTLTLRAEAGAISGFGVYYRRNWD